MYSAKDIAEQLGTDAKTLRRFLRQDPTFNNPGSGGKYSFTDLDVKSLKKRFAQWMKTKSTRAPRARARRAGDAAGLPVSVIHDRSERTRELVRKHAKERVTRLEQRLRDAGLHVSQMKDRS